MVSGGNLGVTYLAMAARWLVLVQLDFPVAIVKSLVNGGLLVVDFSSSLMNC